MLEFEWSVPEMKEQGQGEDLKPKPHPFKGSVKLRIPSYLERLDTVKSLSFEAGSDGKAEEKDRKKFALDMAGKTVDLAKTHIVSMEVTHVKTKKKFASPVELEYYKAGVELLQEIGGVILGGLSLGED